MKQLFAKEKRSSALFLAIALVLSGAVCALGSYYLLYEYDRTLGVYAHGSSASTVLGVCALVSVAAMAACLFLKKDAFACEAAKESAVQRSVDLLCALTSLCLAVLVLMDTEASLLLRLLTALLCLPWVGSLALPYLKKPWAPTAAILCRFALPVILVLRLFYLYFDYHLPIVAPVKEWEILCVVALCAASLMETRAALGIPCPRLRVATTGLALIFTSMSALPQLLRYAAKGESVGVFTVYAVWEAVLLLRFATAWLAELLPEGRQQIFHYLLFGVLTTAVDFAVYTVLTRGLLVLDLVANLLAWVVSVAFAFCVNKFFVFGETNCTPKVLLYEIGCFVGARVLSFGIEELILWLGVYVLAGNDLVAKGIAAVIVIILNYIASKFLIFKKKEQ